MVVLVAVAVTVAIGMVRGMLAPVEHVPTAPAGATERPGGAGTQAPSEESPGGEVTVHVAGAVTAPGVYVLDAGARVLDAVAAAGGFAPAADPGSVNLARPLADGEQLVVLEQGAAPAAPGAEAVADPHGKVNLNAADVTALDTLPRIGPALAARIIDWRETNGPFTSVEDLLAVPGIGEKMLEGIRDLVVL